MRERPCRLEPAGCRRRYSSNTPSAASVPLPSAASPGPIQRLAGWAAAVPAGLERGIVVVAVKAPAELTAAPTAGTPAKSRVWTNALESRVTPPAHSEPAEGPADPDTVTVSPAEIG